ncbi:MAG: hypothetical protein AAGC64_11960 [Bacteroidota bacterium]
MKFFKSNKITEYWTWFTMPLVLNISFFTISCNDSDSNLGPEEEDAESAWLFTIESETPGGDIINYMDVVSEMPSNADLSGAVEIGTNATIKSFGDYVYTISSGSSTITKWKVNKSTLDLSVEGILSYASSGIGFTQTNVFFSESQAYLSDLIQGTILEWNPSTMKITSVHNVDPVIASFPPNLDAWQGNGYVINEKVFWNIRFDQETCCESEFPTDGATIGVFDTETGSVEYKRDARLFIADNIPITDEHGTMYVQPSRMNDMYLNYFNIDNSLFPSPFTVLKLDQTGNFDPNFNLNLGDALPMNWYGRASFIYNDNIVFTSAAFDWEDSFDAAWDFWGVEEYYSNVSVNMTTKEVVPFTAFSGYESVYTVGTFDGNPYFVAYTPGYGSTVLLRQNSVNDFTEISSTDEGNLFLVVEKMW